MCLYVDDVAIHVIGKAPEVAATLVSATRDAIEVMEDEFGLKVSRGDRWMVGGKTVAVVSTNRAAEIIGPSLKAMGIGLNREAQHLGVAYAPARKGKFPSESQRWNSWKRRLPRVKKLGLKAGRRICLRGLLPAMAYGASVRGCTNARLRTAQRLVAAAGTRMKGRSIIARTAVWRCDPAHGMGIEPILRWARAIWEADIEDCIMKAAWTRAMREVALAARPDAAASDPAGALVAAARRVGWRLPTHFAFLTRDGTWLDLRVTCPRTVECYLHDDLDIVQAAGSSISKHAVWGVRRGGSGQRGGGATGSHDGIVVANAYGELDKGQGAEVDERIGYPAELVDNRMVPWFTPTADRVARKGKGALSTAAAGSIASLAEGGWWTQARLFEAHLVACPLCKACMAAPGTLWHRIGRCNHTADLRRLHANPDMIEHCNAHHDDPLVVQGVPARPARQPPPPLVIKWVGKHLPADGAIFTGIACTDGAVRAMGPRWLWRAGWSAMLVNKLGELQFGIYGSCPDAYPSSNRAELWAVWQLMRLALPPLVVLTDSAFVVRGFQRGREWCTAATREGADLWRHVWNIHDDIGGGTRVVKVKAHTSEDDVRNGVIAHGAREGKAQADIWAKAGAAEAARLAPNKSQLRAWRRAAAFIDWAAILAEHWPEDAEAVPTTKRKARQRAEAAAADGGDDAGCHAPDAVPLLPPARARPRPAPRGALDAPAPAHEDSAIAVHAGSPHELWARRGAGKCRKCGRAAPDKRRAAAMARSACAGSIAAAWAEQHGQRGGDKFSVGGMVATGWSLAAVRAARKRAPGDRGVDSEEDQPQPVRPRLTARPPSPEAWRLEEDDGQEFPSDLQDLLADPSPVEEDGYDEDPFGHQLLDMDTGEAHGHGDAPRRDASQSEGRLGLPPHCGSGGSDGGCGGGSGDAAAQTGDGVPVKRSIDQPAEGLMAAGSAEPGGSGTPRAKRPRAADRAESEHAAQDAGVYGEAVAPAACEEADGSAVAGAAGLEGVSCAAGSIGDAQPRAPALGAAPRWGPGHDLRAVANIVYCRRCGHYASSRLVALARPCQGVARGVFPSRLRRLREGRHPLTGAALT